MLDASVVLSKVGSGTVNERHQLSPAAPDRIVDAGPSGANVIPISGAVLSASYANDGTLGAWSTVPGAGQAVGAGRRAFRLADTTPAVILVSWA